MGEAGTLYERLERAASLEGEDAAIRIAASYEPVGGAGDKVSPPTYPVDGTPLPYLFERRWDESGEEVRTVLLDSRQAQANRCEEAIQEEIDTGRLAVPHIELTTVTHEMPLRITSLEAPHRSRDAYFRDAEDERGTRFDQTKVGQALRSVRPEDARPLYLHSPADLVYGVWDSHRDLRLATRFPRVYTSEVVGWRVLEGVRAAGRFDLVVSGAEKVVGGNEDWEPAASNGRSRSGKNITTLGHGSIPPSVNRAGGVTVERIGRAASVGFAGLARLRFGGLPEPAARAARAVLAAIALLGDRLAFARPGLFLRSGCELVLINESLSWVGRRGSEPLELDIDGARALLDKALATAEAAGLTWPSEPVALRPQTKLQDLIDRAFYSSPIDAEVE